MSVGGPYSERAIVLERPVEGQPLPSSILREAGIVTHVCADLPTLCGALDIGGAVSLIAEDAVACEEIDYLARLHARQPPWSDLPVIVMIARPSGAERSGVACRLGETLGNVSFLERPFHATTLASLVQVAVRGRRRQYEARARLDELRASEQRLRTALLAGRRGAWSLSVGDWRLETDAACAAQYGRGQAGELTYDAFRAGMHPDDKARQQAAARRSIETGEDYVIEYRFVWPDGSVHWIDVRAGAMRDGSGRVTQLVGVSADITARKQLETDRERLLADLATERLAAAELNAGLEKRVAERTAQLASEVKARTEAQDQLLQSQKMESLGQLTGGVAHDFNNLLMAVMGNLELLAKHLAGDARAQHLIDGAMQGAERGAALTRRMLAFARQQALHTTTADIPALVSGMRALLERSLEPRIRLEIEAPGDGAMARVDANQFELAILNLVINARDAIAGRGLITVAAGRRDVVDEMGVARSFASVAVTDTGAGMDAETLRRAVDPFFSTKPVGEGSGLGLSMVHGLANQLGGSLEMSSEPGRGTVATLLLPIEEDAVPDPDPPAQRPRSRRATILVVDDDALIAMSTVDMIEDLGHAVVEAHSGREALATLDAEPAIDLMITDHAMPGMTGVELARAARAKRPDLPILLATGYAELPAGEDEIDLPRLSKPYQQSQLERAIDTLLAARSADNGAASWNPSV